MIPSSAGPTHVRRAGQEDLLPGRGAAWSEARGPVAFGGKMIDW